jgi:hypothetical protein
MMFWYRRERRKRRTRRRQKRQSREADARNNIIGIRLYEILFEHQW